MHSNSVFIIGEIGCNHDGDLAQARALIDVAAEARCDAVKFQLFRADVLYPTSDPAHAVLKSNELPRGWVPLLSEYALGKGVQFLASPFDVEAVGVLEAVGVGFYKVASSELRNTRLLLSIARTCKPVFMSTGMCTLAEISEAIDLLDANGCPEIVLLHCYSVYPTPIEDVNLRVMDTLHHTFGREVGLSDHSLGITVPIAAAARGARAVEKHFTLSRSLSGPDHGYALEPTELAEMVQRIRDVERALGTPVKKLHPLEVEYCRLDGIYTSRDLAAGERISADDVVVRRPFRGVAARYASGIIGLELRESLSAGTAIDWRHLR